MHLRRDDGDHRACVSLAVRQCARDVVRLDDAGDLRQRLHPHETAQPSVHPHRRRPRRPAADHWMGGRVRVAQSRGVGVVRDPLSLAAAAFPRDRLGASGRLPTSRISDAVRCGSDRSEHGPSDGGLRVGAAGDQSLSRRPRGGRLVVCPGGVKSGVVVAVGRLAGGLALDTRGQGFRQGGATVVPGVGRLPAAGLRHHGRRQNLPLIMERSARRLLWSVWAVAVVSGVGLLWYVADAAKAVALPRYGRVPSFTLTDQAGGSVSQETFKGVVWIADFIFTRCAGQCPVMTAQMSRLAQAFQGEPSLVLVSFTVDPAHDPPEILARYAASHAARPAQWRFLTGDLQTITRLSQAGFQLALSYEGTVDEPITHSRRFVLVDRQGVIRGSYDAGEAEAMTRIRRDVQRLVREQPHAAVGRSGDQRVPQRHQRGPARRRVSLYPCQADRCPYPLHARGVPGLDRLSRLLRQLPSAGRRDAI